MSEHPAPAESYAAAVETAAVETAAAETRALRPLWLLASGVAAACAGARLVVLPGSGVAQQALIVLGVLAVIIGIAGRRRHLWLVWLLAGLALAGGRGLQERSHELILAQRVAAISNLALRVEAVVKDGWSRARWGWQAPIVITSAEHRQEVVSLPRLCRLEIRGKPEPWTLPGPGTAIKVLASVRGTPQRPLLVVSSARLLEQSAPPQGLPRLRDHLARGLLDAAGTDLQRIRAAELAAVLAVGRRDLLPAERRRGWRRSGLAHLLAVSGLHVGLVAGTVWLLAVPLAGMRPVTARWLVLLVLPAYALLAGAAPSALRAALMGMIYLGARLLGRALLPMAAVLLAAVALLLWQPSMIAHAGFQLTVVITAALVRWAPSAARSLPGPAWLGAALAVPLVAQAAALPIAGWHFRTAIPGAAIANLLVPLLMAPALLVALTATALAQLWSTGAAWLLDLLTLLEHGLWLCGAPGRTAEVVLPLLPVLLLLLLVAAGWLALQAGARAGWAAAAWLILLVLGGAWHGLRPGLPPEQVTLLPVADGAAALLPAGDHPALYDGGRYHYQAAELLADAGVGRLGLVLASHGDEDHLGGLERVIETCPVERLVLPAWMLSEVTAVPLLRAARRHQVLVTPVVRGNVIELAETRFEVLWPPALAAPRDENDRSLVVRVRRPQGTILVTADISRRIEARLAASTALRCDVLIAPHHGSKSSSSPVLLDATRARVVLIPAGSGNTHGHPHPDVLGRLADRRTPFRYPARDSWCGARPDDNTWRPWP